LLFCKGDYETYSKLSDKIVQDYKNNPNSLNDIQPLLLRLFDKDKWQKCFLSNVFVHESNMLQSAINSVMVYPFPKDIYKQIILNIFSRNHNIELVAGCRISGLFAHDITIRNLGRVYEKPLTQSIGWQNTVSAEKHSNKEQYSITVSDSPEHLTKKDILTVLRLGLNDLNEMCHRNNRSFLKRAIMKNNTSGFLYETMPECKQTDQLCSELITQAELLEAQEKAQEQLQCVEEQLNELPPESFEKNPQDETIGSIEL
jgi:hypothetical protein